MGKVIMMNAVTLDGVMQSPGRPDEDTRDGFQHGGWGIPYGDEAMVAKMGERLGEERAFLFGRRTYEQLLRSWNARGGPCKEALNDARKYEASSNSATRLDWPNSTLLHGDVPATVADLKQSSSANLVIMGSGVLIASLGDEGRGERAFLAQALWDGRAGTDKEPHNLRVGFLGNLVDRLHRRSALGLLAVA